MVEAVIKQVKLYALRKLTFQQRHTTHYKGKIHRWLEGSQCYRLKDKKGKQSIKVRRDERL